MNKQTKEFEAFVAKMIYLQTVTVFIFGTDIRSILAGYLSN